MGTVAAETSSPELNEDAPPRGGSGGATGAPLGLTAAEPTMADRLRRAPRATPTGSTKPGSCRLAGITRSDLAIGPNLGNLLCTVTPGVLMKLVAPFSVSPAGALGAVAGAGVGMGPAAPPRLAGDGEIRPRARTPVDPTTGLLDPTAELPPQLTPLSTVPRPPPLQFPAELDLIALVEALGAAIAGRASHTKSNSSRFCQLALAPFSKYIQRGNILS